MKINVFGDVFDDTEIEEAVATAVQSVNFLNETIIMVEANRAKFEHIDAVRKSREREKMNDDA